MLRKATFALAFVGALGACNTAGVIVGDDNSGVLDAARKDAQLVCSIRDQLPVGDGVRSAAELICALAENLPVAAAADPREVTSACAKTADVDKTADFSRYWRAVCDERMSGDVEAALRAASAGEAYFRTLDPAYAAPKIVLFNGETPSPCSTISAAAYCPASQKVYLDPDHLPAYSADQTVRVFYVVVHELAHHWQDGLEAGIFAYGLSDDHARVFELGADCHVGAAAKFAGASEFQLEAGLRMAIAIGGHPSGSHGSGEMRAEAARRGYDGEPCDG